MKYILSANIALRGWKLVPRAYYVRGASAAGGLSREDFETLLLCDGKTDVPPSPELESLLERGFCKPSDGAELTGWQRYRYCDNRYFPGVNWAVTGKCNFNCRHCFNAADNSPLMDEFTAEQCMDFIRQLDECGVQNVTLTGGEPMMHPNFLDICRELDKRGMVLEAVTTNGSFITPEILDELSKLDIKPRIKISFDGVGHHDWFRMKEGSEREVIDKTKLLPERGFSVLFQTNVHRGNRETILPTLIMAEQIGVTDVRVIRTSEAPRWSEMGGDLCLSLDEYYDFTLGLIEGYIGAGLTIPVDVWQVIKFNGRHKTYHHWPVASSVLTYRDSIPVCKGNRGLIAVTPEGDLVPCNQMSGWLKKHGVRMGNVHETPLRELLSESDYLTKVCYTVGELREENPKCKACPYWKLCTGGCRASGIFLGGGYNKLDPVKCLYFNGYLDKFTAGFGGEWRCLDDLALEQEQ